MVFVGYWTFEDRKERNKVPVFSSLAHLHQAAKRLFYAIVHGAFHLFFRMHSCILFKERIKERLYLISKTWSTGQGQRLMALPG